MSEFFNDGAVPHGGFIATFNTAGPVKIESFSPDLPGKTVNRPDTISSPNGWAGVNDQPTATATAQIPTSAGSAILLGDYFTAPAGVGGGKWVVTGKGGRFNMGDYWKEELRLQAALLS
jgi:hypothetical protein